MTFHPDVHYEGVRFSSVPHQLLEEVADPIAIALYAHPMKFADWSTGLAHPKRETLAKLMGYKTTKAVDSAVKVLVKSGWLETFPRWSRWNEETNSLEVIYESRKGFNQTSNGYRLFDRPRRSGGEGAPEGTHPYPQVNPPHTPRGIQTITIRTRTIKLVKILIILRMIASPISGTRFQERLVRERRVRRGRRP